MGRGCKVRIRYKSWYSRKNPWKSIGARLYDLLKHENTKYVKVGVRPRRFQLKENISDKDENTLLREISKKEDEEDKKSAKFNERDLHPLLVKYVNSDPHFNANCKTIYHEKSARKKMDIINGFIQI